MIGSTLLSQRLSLMARFFRQDRHTHLEGVLELGDDNYQTLSTDLQSTENFIGRTSLTVFILLLLRCVKAIHKTSLVIYRSIKTQVTQALIL